MFKWINVENPVAIWWIFLSSVAVVNFIFLFWLRRYFKKSKSDFTKKLFFLSALYTIGCGYRSVFPKADVQRIALFDTWLSSVFLGRTVATIAELAFVAQWAFVIFHYSRIYNQKTARQISLLLVPLIMVAEVFSWYAVVTTNYIGNTIEESLWTLCYVLIGICLFFVQKKLDGYLQLAARIGVLGCVIYVSFMSLVDVPMYWNRFTMDTESGKNYFGLWDGLIDLNTRWHVTHDIRDWRDEIPWMSLYFSLAVWISLAMTFVPDPRQVAPKKKNFS